MAVRAQIKSVFIFPKLLVTFLKSVSSAIRRVHSVSDDPSTRCKPIRTNV